VIVPVVVPFTLTETPGIGEPSSADVTFPEICFVWAITVEMPVNKTNPIRNNCFID
jgi:hypothetical protein